MEFTAGLDLEGDPAFIAVNGDSSYDYTSYATAPFELDQGRGGTVHAHPEPPGASPRGPGGAEGPGERVGVAGAAAVIRLRRPGEARASAPCGDRLRVSCASRAG